MRLARFTRIRPPAGGLRRAIFLLVFASVVAVVRAQAPARPAPVVTGVRLDDLTWAGAEQRLTADAVVLLPLGAAAQEHGLHLKLGNDRIVADYLTRRMLEISDVVAAPPLPYHYFPAFDDYPGSATLSLDTARDVTADVARSFARQGPRRFYVLNVGLSSSEALAAAAKTLAGEGILLHYTDWRSQIEGWRGRLQQPGGDHAGEFETSLMLYIDPSSVAVGAASRDYSPARGAPFRLTRRQGSRGTFSPTGAWGDPTLATREKGRVIVESLVSSIKADIELLRRASLPPAGTPIPGLTAARPAQGPPAEPQTRPGECLAGDERTIRELGPAFFLAWQNQDADRIASLWSDGGDMAHPDGLVESTPRIIRQNRAYLFSQREYKDSKHYLTVGTVRCITRDVAVADAKWELRGVTDGRGNITPPAEGLCTLVLKRAGGSWAIEAWRYNMKPSAAATQPTILKKPGFPTVIR
jgi:creatinine amidohydrolase